MNLYTNNPSRFGGCYATHNPFISQTSGTVTTTPAPGGSSGGGRFWTPHTPRRTRKLDDVEIVIKKKKRVTEVTVPVPMLDGVLPAIEAARKSAEISRQVDKIIEDIDEEETLILIFKAL